MLKASVAICLFLCVGLGACKKQSPAKPPAQDRSPMARQPTSPSPHIPKVPIEDAKAVLTEDKISRYAIYLRNVLGMPADAASLARAASQKGRTDAKKPQGTTAANDRTATVPADRQLALAKSGLGEQEVGTLNHILRPYYFFLFRLQNGDRTVEEARARVEDAKAKGKQPSPADQALLSAHAEQVNRIEAARNNFARTYGEDAFKLVEKHEPEFFTIHQKMRDPGRP